MLPVGDYMDAFGAVIPFTKSGVWQVSIQVYRVGSVPAMSTFTIACCGELASGQIARDVLNQPAVGGSYQEGLP
jgi:hypothetical protein